MRPNLPTGTVTFLCTDIEGSTNLLHELGAERYANALGGHRAIIREACSAESGLEVDSQRDARLFAFQPPPGAVAAVSEMTSALSAGPIRVRLGLHTATPLLAEEGYVGDDVHRAARIAASGHGGQVLVSASTASLVDLDLRDLGEHRLKDLSGPETAATLWGAVCAVEHELGFRMLGTERRRYEARLAPLETAPAWTAGKELTLQEAEALAAATLD